MNYPLNETYATLIPALLMGNSKFRHRQRPACIIIVRKKQFNNFLVTLVSIYVINHLLCFPWKLCWWKSRPSVAWCIFWRSRLSGRRCRRVPWILLPDVDAKPCRCWWKREKSMDLPSLVVPMRLIDWSNNIRIHTAWNCFYNWRPRIWEFFCRIFWKNPTNFPRRSIKRYWEVRRTPCFFFAETQHKVSRICFSFRSRINYALVIFLPKLTLDRAFFYTCSSSLLVELVCKYLI